MNVAFALPESMTRMATRGSDTMKMLDSRRLTGPNLLWDRPGAIIDIEASAIELDQLIPVWQRQIQLILEGVNWSDQAFRIRSYTGGASLVISAPVDALYAATEVNEAALNRAVLLHQGDQPGNYQPGRCTVHCACLVWTGCICDLLQIRNEHSRSQFDTGRDDTAGGYRGHQRIPAGSTHGVS